MLGKGCRSRCHACPVHHILSLLHELGSAVSCLLLQLLLELHDLLQRLLQRLLGGVCCRPCGMQHGLRALRDSIQDTLQVLSSFLQLLLDLLQRRCCRRSLLSRVVALGRYCSKSRSLWF